MANPYPVVEPPAPGAVRVSFDYDAAATLHATFRLVADQIRAQAAERGASADRWLGTWEGRFRRDFDTALGELTSRLAASAVTCDDGVRILVTAWERANELQAEYNRQHLFTVAAAQAAPGPVGFPV